MRFTALTSVAQNLCANGRLLAVLLALSINVSGCEPPTQINVRRYVPSVLTQAGIQEVKVDQLGGYGGDEMTTHVIHAITQRGAMRALLGDGAERRVDADASKVQIKIRGAMLYPDIRIQYDAEESGHDEHLVTTYTRKLHITPHLMVHVVNESSGRIIQTLDIKGAEITNRRVISQGGPKNRFANDGESLFGSPDPSVIHCEARREYESLAKQLSAKLVATYKDSVIKLYDKEFSEADSTMADAAAKGQWAAAVTQYAHAVAEATDDAQRARALYYYGICLGYSAQYEKGIAALEESYALVQNEHARRTADQIRNFARKEQSTGL